MNTCNRSQRDLKESSLVELLKQKSQQGQDILVHYIRSFVIYAAIIGGLVKFAMDAATPELRQKFLAAGILVSVVGLLTCVFGEGVRRSIVREITNLNRKLGCPLISTDLSHIRYAVIIAFCFIIVVLASLIYLLVR